MKRNWLKLGIDKYLSDTFLFILNYLQQDHLWSYHLDLDLEYTNNGVQEKTDYNWFLVQEDENFWV